MWKVAKRCEELSNVVQRMWTFSRYTWVPPAHTVVAQWHSNFWHCDRVPRLRVRVSGYVLGSSSDLLGHFMSLGTCLSQSIKP